MDDRERFKAICAGERPDYVPIFGFPGAGGMSQGVLRSIHRRLVEQGMPAWVDGCRTLGESCSVERGQCYWGTTGPVTLDFFPAEPARGIRTRKRIEDGCEIVESETGAVTRQVLDNDEVYSMPEFVVYDVRDRASWEFYRERVRPGRRWSADRIEEACRRFDRRDRPLVINVGSTWGRLRSLMGPEAACAVLYDDPELAHEIIDFFSRLVEEYVFSLVERLKPEALQAWEDCCYNHGIVISPVHFEEFCASRYRKVGELARACGVDMVVVDSDGNVMELVGLLEACGVNALYPFEAKAGNDLFLLRERHPEFIFLGWLEKEVVNEGNECLIEPELTSKVPPLLEKGRYFPNLEHAMQPMATFRNLCRFMTLLHEMTGNPEGEFPRVWD